MDFVGGFRVRAAENHRRVARKATCEVIAHQARDMNVEASEAESEAESEAVSEAESDSSLFSELRMEKIEMDVRWKKQREYEQRMYQWCLARSTWTLDGPPKCCGAMADDVIYQDEWVCILKPRSTRGTLIFHETLYSKSVNVLTEGLKSGRQLEKEGGIPIPTLSMKHPYCFFRAPYQGKPESEDTDMKKIDVATNMTILQEIETSYGATDFSDRNVYFIRVDPDQTYVFPSELRASIPAVPGGWEYEVLTLDRLKRTGKTMREYLEVVSTNSKITGEDSFLFNLETGKKIRESQWNLEVDGKIPGQPVDYPWDRHDISTESEVLVAIPHMPKEYFISKTGKISSD